MSPLPPRAVPHEERRHWVYDEPPPDDGEVLLLLTAGGVPVVGRWRHGGGYLAWARMPRRDRARECASGAPRHDPRESSA